MSTNSYQHGVYIAGPFFNPEQLDLIINIESVLHANGVSYFSPRSFGVLGEMDPDERRSKTKIIYDKNIEQIRVNNVMLAVIDDRDVGTIFEIGYAAALRDKFNRRKIVTISNKGYGMNVMLRESVDAHLHGLTNLADCMKLAVTDKLDGEQFMADRGEAW